MRSLVPTLALVAYLILATAGCQSTPRDAIEPAPAAEPAKAVDAPSKPGLSAAAAAARETLGEAEALAREGDWVGATALFSILPPADLSPADLPRHSLLGAQLAIRAGNLDEARRLLASLDASRLPDPVDGQLMEAWLVAASGSPARAAAQLMQATVPAASRQRVNDTIWELVTLTPAFEALALVDRGTEVEQGWWGLRGELLHSASLADQAARVAAWRAARPEHSAAMSLPAALKVPASGYARPRRVALLLPVTGPLARAGRAVRDGYLAAWFEQPADQRFEISIYDTAGDSLDGVYRRAVAGGADVIVGPLRREDVSAISELAPQVPVLALNYLEAGDPAPNLAQLGLAIEDDVASLVRWLQDTGLQRIMVLHGPHEWAARVERALGDQGMAPVATYLLPEMRTVTDAVGSAMHIEDSKARYAELQRLMNVPIAFTPRSRTDIDAVVALVNAVEITALVPALRFHYANRIPAFATAQTLQGANSSALRTMNGFHVVELPWQAPGDPGRQVVARAFPIDGNPFASMYALGADAFRLTDRIHPANRGAFTQILGNTGLLTLLPDGRVQRELARMQVAGGRLSLAETR